MTVPTYQSRLWLEIWRRPGHATFGNVIGDAPIETASYTSRANGVGEGTAELPSNYTRLDEILKADPTTPANAVSSLARVFQEGVTGPIAEWLPAEMTGADSKTDRTVTVKGADIMSLLGYARVEAWDWDGTDDHQSQFPDWVYKGKDLVGPVEAFYQPHIFRVWNIASGGNVGIGISANGGAIQTATVAFNATAATVKTNIEALSNVTSAEVQGSGTESNPWEIRLLLPTDTYVVTIDSSGLTGTTPRAYTDIIQNGKLIPVTWTPSRNPSNNIDHGILTDFRASLGGGADPALPAGCSAWVVFNGTEEEFPGVQKIVKVQAGGIYQNPPMQLYAQGAGATLRIVIRDVYENFIAAEEITLVSNTLTPTVGLANVTIPDGITDVIFRIGHIGSGDPPPIFIACPSFREGLAPTTWGGIFTQLYADATSDHASRRVWQIGATAASYLTLDFSASVDSAGAAWTHSEVAITLKRGQSYLKVLQECTKQGYEARIVFNNYVTGTWKLQIYNPGTAGTVLNASNSPVIMGGRDVSKRDVRKFLPTYTDWAVEAGQKNIARERSSTAITALGRIEGYTPNQDLGSLTEAGIAAASSLSAGLASSQSLTYTVAGVNGAYPLVDFKVFDTINVDDPPDVTKVARRIKQIQLSWNKQETNYTLQLGSESYVGVGAIYEATNKLLLEFKAIRDTPQDLSDLNLIDMPGSGGGGFTVRVAASDSGPDTKGAAHFECTGTNDEGIIQKAINYANALSGVSGGEVVLGEGNYNIAIPASGAAIDVKTNVQVRGMGSATVVVSSNTALAAGHMFNLQFGAKLFEMIIRDLSGYGHLLIRSGSDDILLRGVWVEGASTATAIFFDNSDKAQITECLVSAGTILIQDGVGWTIDHNWYLEQVIVEGDAEQWTINNNPRWTNDTAECLIIRLEGGQMPSFGQVHDNNISGFAATGAWPLISVIGEAYGLGGTYDGLIIFHDNFLDNSNGDGLYVETSAVIFHHNHVDGIQRHGVHLNAASHSVITDNFFNAIGLETGNTYDGIFLEGNCDRAKIVGNTIRDDATPSIRYSINISASTCDETRVWHNDGWQGFTTTFINNAGTNTRFTPAGGTTNPGDNISS